MPVELPREAEHLLIDLASVEREIERYRKQLDKRELEIAESLLKEVRVAPAAERKAALTRAAERLNTLRGTTFRSELASLMGTIVTAERRRAQILRSLDTFPQLGESVPVVDLVVEHDGEREFVIKTGGGRNFCFTMPAIIDRGVWRGDGKYERGDAVTFDGSLWIAREDDPKHEPGKGSQWRLAVTRGRNGRDASRK